MMVPANISMRHPGGGTHTNMIKVDSPSVGGVSSSKRAQKKDSKAGFSRSIGTQAPGASAAIGMSGVNASDMLVMLQEIEEAPPQTAQERASSLISYLEQLQLGILSSDGGLSEIERLSVAVKAKRENCTDPSLDKILSFIEQRVSVELAKRGIY